MGAISPGRWHSWQSFWRIGSTSLWNVTAAGAANKLADTNKVGTTKRFKIRLLILLFGLFSTVMHSLDRFWFRRILRVPFRRACVGPRGERFDVVVRQVTVVFKLAEMWIGGRWWHPLCNHHLDRLGPRTRAFVIQEADSTGFTRPVTALAFSLQYRQNILI